MLLDLNKLIEKYNLKINGVLHVGAHYGQEYDLYEKNNIKNLIFFEPVPETFNVLKKNLDTKVILINKALGNTNGKISMNIETANNGQSSSILEPEIHLKQYPHIKFNNKIEVEIVKMDDFFKNEKYLNVYDYNMINIDVQGYELEVFKGSEETLKNIDYIVTEVNRDNVYRNCVLVDELDDFLNKFNFIRIETSWDGFTWGDAFYMKNK